ncbi:MAG: hypothetical protein ACK4FL_00920 [Microgenomates group bacterium]
MENLINLISEINRYALLNLNLYIIFSFIYIMIYHLAVNFGSEFNLMITTFFFIFGAILGHFFSFEFGFLVAVVLSFIFISGPRKDL